MTTPSIINQLVIVVVTGNQAGELTHHLGQQGFYFTQIDSHGGILQEATVCLLIGLNDARREALLALIKEQCHQRRQFIPANLEAPLLQMQPAMIEAEVGGATAYVLAVERFEQI